MNLVASGNGWQGIVRSVVMNRYILIVLVALLAVNSLLLAEQPAYKPGVVLVRFKNQANNQPPATAAKSAIVNTVLQSSGSSVRQEYTLVQGLTQVGLPAGMSVENAVASLRQSLLGFVCRAGL